jgi:hypothetical protein
MKVVPWARLAGAGALLLVLGIGVAPAQRQFDTDVKRPVSKPSPAALTPDDPIIPAPGELSRETDSRRFVESFLVALFQEDLGLVYDTYLHSLYTDVVTKEAFAADVGKVRGLLGPLDRLAVMYLREDNAVYAGADGGYAEFLMLFQRDPQVTVHVEFRRAGDGMWSVSRYMIKSVLAENLRRAEETARGAVEEESQEAAGEGAQQDPGEEPPPR